CDRFSVTIQLRVYIKKQRKKRTCKLPFFRANDPGSEHRSGRRCRGGQNMPFSSLRNPTRVCGWVSIWRRKGLWNGFAGSFDGDEGAISLPHLLQLLWRKRFRSMPPVLPPETSRQSVEWLYRLLQRWR